ncbi:DUF4430 domain-containing protein [Bacillus luteolus]|uniref:DUF4430 domain-containing protein n=1 Tax=Litchfieldia luteola TaxID=682179 RepID=A0ABR9QF66_9BACI|nr:DUF4430 domain-containing protein [Cytobacillus luteolus]MBE4907136.1 DUF4430 domain-containing protein [Cytobacillus luteolus]MBP1943394.1 DNA mismatch repair ATPase MutL [Cytobacillus luteolus]
MKMAKLVKLPTLILIIAMLVSGCGNNSETTKPIVEDTGKEDTIEVVENNVDSEAETESSDSKPETEVVEKSTEKPTDTTKPNDTDSTSESKNTTEPTTTAKKETPKQETTSQSKKEETKPKTPETKPKTTEATKPKPAEPPATKATITVIGPADVGTLINTTEVAFKDGDTILDVLLQIAKKAGIHVDYTGSGAMGYVVGIDNYYEFDYGPKSGWTCKLNGSTLSKSSDAIKVKEGDRIDWIYTENYSNDK